MPDSFELMTMHDLEIDNYSKPHRVVRFQYHWYTDYFKETLYPGFLDYELADHLVEWLDRHATISGIAHYEISIDRGDFGEGVPVAVIDFKYHSDAQAFYDKFNRRINVDG